MFNCQNRGCVAGCFQQVRGSVRCLGGEVEAVVVVGAEGRVALGALPLARLVARAQAVPAEHVEALRQHRVLAFHLIHQIKYNFTEIINAKFKISLIYLKNGEMDLYEFWHIWITV